MMLSIFEVILDLISYNFFLPAGCTLYGRTTGSKIASCFCICCVSITYMDRYFLVCRGTWMTSTGVRLNLLVHDTINRGNVDTVLTRKGDSLE